MNAQELKEALRQFTGTDQWYRHMFGLVYTSGVRYFAENAGGGAYWWLDIVATELMQIQKAGQPFMTATIESSGSSATLFATDGNDNRLWTRELEFTDCPEGVWGFYLIDGTFLLPSEY
jgi:hypothetical protein